MKRSILYSGIGSLLYFLTGFAYLFYSDELGITFVIEMIYVPIIIPIMSMGFGGSTWVEIAPLLVLEFFALWLALFLVFQAIGFILKRISKPTNPDGEQ